MTGIILQTVV